VGVGVGMWNWLAGWLEGCSRGVGAAIVRVAGVGRQCYLYMIDFVAVYKCALSWLTVAQPAGDVTNIPALLDQYC